MHSTVSSYSSWTSSTYKRYNGEYFESSTGSRMGNQYSSNVYFTKNYPSTRACGGGGGGNGCSTSDSDHDNNAFIRHNYYYHDNNNVQGQRNRHYCHIERKYPLNYSSSTSSTISSSSSYSSNYSADSFSSASAIGTGSLSQRNHYTADIDANSNGSYGNSDFEYDNKERNLHLARSYTSKPAKFTSTCTNLLSRFTSKLCLNDRKDLITDNINYQNNGKHLINNNNNDNDYLVDYRNHIYASKSANKITLRPATGSNTMTNGMNRNANGSFISLNSSGSTSSFSSSGASSIDDHNHHHSHYRLNNNYTNLPPIHPKYSTKYSYTNNSNLINNDNNCGSRYSFRSPLLKTSSSSAITNGNHNTTREHRLYNDRQLNSLTTTSSTSRIRTLKENSYLSYNTNYNYNSSTNNRYQLRYQTTSGISNNSSSKYTSDYRAESSYLMKKFPTTTITPYRSYLVQKKSISRNYTRVFDSGFDHNSSVCIAILFECECDLRKVKGCF